MLLDDDFEGAPCFDLDFPPLKFRKSNLAARPSLPVPRPPISIPAMKNADQASKTLTTELTPPQILPATVGKPFFTNFRCIFLVLACQDFMSLVNPTISFRRQTHSGSISSPAERLLADPEQRAHF